MLISSFDAVLALFVKRTFLWSSTGAGLIFLAITVPLILGAFIGGLSDRYGTRAVAIFCFAVTVPSLALLGVVTNGSVPDQAALVILLVANGKFTITLKVPFCELRMLISFLGVGLNFILAPLAADMFDEVEVLVTVNPNSFGTKGAFAQAYSLFDAALGLATVVGPGLSGALYTGANWQIMAGTLALLCAVGGVPVWRFTGKTEQDGSKKKRNYAISSEQGAEV